jgi:16S rRNA (cytosine1402-N4)-methyltransferase
MDGYFHIPVMLTEALEYLAPKAGGLYFDGTLGGGGYTFALAKIAGFKGGVLATDLDPSALANARNKLEENLKLNIELVHDNFSNLDEAIANSRFAGRKFDGFVFDLGLSSAQLEDETRGFSFLRDAPLDMDFAGSNRTIQLVSRLSELSLKNTLSELGEERFSGRIAKAIVTARKRRPITTTGQLAEIVSQAVPAAFRRGPRHPATQTFQALRIATNDELENIRLALPAAFQHLKSGGRIVVVSFHSLEDRIVKTCFRGLADRDNPQARLLLKKPLVPSEIEIASNPRARSAKLRALQKI